MKHTISILVENEFGALARIAGLFSGRGFNIESLSVAPSLDHHISRMTITTVDVDVEQVIKQLNKLISVIKVQDVTGEDTLTRTLSMIKVNLSRRNHKKLQSLMQGYDARVVDSDDRCSVVQVVEDDERLKAVLESLKPYGIIEFVSTGALAVQRGKKVIKA